MRVIGKSLKSPVNQLRKAYAAAFILLREKVKSRAVQFGILAVGMAALMAHLRSGA